MYVKLLRQNTCCSMFHPSSLAKVYDPKRSPNDPCLNYIAKVGSEAATLCGNINKTTTRL